MRKLVLLFLSIIALNANAQGIHFIPKVAINQAYMTDINHPRFKPGLTIGVGTEFMIGPFFALEPGIYYSMQGYKAKTESKVNLTLKNNYINVPLYAKVYLFKGVHVFAGPQASYRLNTKATVSSGQTWLGEHIEKITHNIDFSGIMGAGYQCRSGFLFSANYNVGVLDVYKNNVTIDGQTIEVKNLLNPKNRVIQFNVGWRF